MEQKPIKHTVVSVRLNDEQVQALKELAQSNKVERNTTSSAIAYLVNQYMTLGK